MKKPLLKTTLLTLLLAGASLASEHKMTKEEIVQATQNPLTAMYSIPIQNNTSFGIGPDNKTKNVANFQPVIPVDISENWTMVTRTIMPVISQESGLIPGQGSKFGLGDTTFSAFFTQKNASKDSWLWGAGPVVYLPTATEDVYKTKKWGAGPAAVAVKVYGKWLVGALVMNVWSFAGEDNGKDINLFTLQPFLNYNLPNGWFIASSPIITANWEENNNERWNVPLGAGVGKTVYFGNIPGVLQAHGYYNVVSPDTFGETWQMRLQVQFLFPTK